MADSQRKQASDTAPSGNRAFTLLELMVAVAIISVMVMGFSGLLTGARRVVVTSQRRMRANAAAAAIAGVIRDDMRRASKAGIMKIGDGTLLFTTVAPTGSLLTGDTGEGSIVSYGHFTGNNAGILYRQGWVLAGAAATGDDCTAQKTDWPEILPELQILSSADMGTFGDNDFGAAPTTVTIGSPPETLVHLKGMWQVLADNCTALEIAYWSAGGSWTSDPQTWTRHDQTNWPDAVRFKLTIGSGAVAEILEETDTYEVICPVGP